MRLGAWPVRAAAERQLGALELEQERRDLRQALDRPWSVDHLRPLVAESVRALAVTLRSASYYSCCCCRRYCNRSSDIVAAQF